MVRSEQLQLHTRALFHWFLTGDSHNATKQHASGGTHCSLSSPSSTNSTVDLVLLQHLNCSTLYLRSALFKIAFRYFDFNGVKRKTVVETVTPFVIAFSSQLFVLKDTKLTGNTL